ncbi:MAG TPA: biotin transporter BioY [Coriobacteriia bacterium]|nr:biotin transporter BioY [Coriobacteriia bacterium]
MTSRRAYTTNLVTAALVAALLAASAWITIPVGAVPVTLQVFFVVLAALLLPPRWAMASMGLYLALGAAGLPIFSGANGGLGVLLGPTGGYLWGFLLGAGTGALARTALEGRVRPVLADAIAALDVIAVVYIVGAAQLAFVANLTAGQAITAGILPFILPDLAKAAVAAVAASAVRRSRRA